MSFRIFRRLNSLCVISVAFELLVDACRLHQDDDGQHLHCYFTVDRLRSQDAMYACPEGSYLAIMNDAEEYQFLYDYLVHGETCILLYS